MNAREPAVRHGGLRHGCGLQHEAKDGEPDQAVTGRRSITAERCFMGASRKRVHSTIHPGGEFLILMFNMESEIGTP
jgi:hypothetical protein